MEENYGIYDIDKKFKELEDVTHVQNWVSCDTKLGVKKSLVLCFSVSRCCLGTSKMFQWGTIRN
jgi:hypothetical protein